MKTYTHAWNRGAVVIHHCKTEGDGQEQACEVVKIKNLASASGGEGRFHAEPNHEDSGKGSEQVLAHCVEEAKILREQIVDGLIDELEVVHRSGSFDAPGMSKSF